MTIDETGYRLRAYRLLDSRLRELGYQYPLHLIATEVDPADEERLLQTAVSLGAPADRRHRRAACRLYGARRRSTRAWSSPSTCCRPRARALTKTEFVACPSCGRTLFDLQSHHRADQGAAPATWSA